MNDYSFKVVKSKRYGPNVAHLIKYQLLTLYLALFGISKQETLYELSCHGLYKSFLLLNTNKYI